MHLVSKNDIEEVKKLAQTSMQSFIQLKQLEKKRGVLEDQINSLNHKPKEVSALEALKRETRAAVDSSRAQRKRILNQMSMLEEKLENASAEKDNRERVIISKSNALEFSSMAKENMKENLVNLRAKSAALDAEIKKTRKLLDAKVKSVSKKLQEELFDSKEWKKSQPAFQALNQLGLDSQSDAENSEKLKFAFMTSAGFYADWKLELHQPGELLSVKLSQDDAMKWLQRGFVLILLGGAAFSGTAFVRGGLQKNGRDPRFSFNNGMAALDPAKSAMQFWVPTTLATIAVGLATMIYYIIPNYIKREQNKLMEMHDAENAADPFLAFSENVSNTDAVKAILTTIGILKNRPIVEKFVEGMQKEVNRMISENIDKSTENGEEPFDPSKIDDKVVEDIFSDIAIGLKEQMREDARTGKYQDLRPIYQGLAIYFNDKGIYEKFSHGAKEMICDTARKVVEGVNQDKEVTAQKKRQSEAVEKKKATDASLRKAEEAFQPEGTLSAEESVRQKESIRRMRAKAEQAEENYEQIENESTEAAAELQNINKALERQERQLAFLSAQIRAQRETAELSKEEKKAAIEKEIAPLDSQIEALKAADKEQRKKIETDPQVLKLITSTGSHWAATNHLGPSYEEMRARLPERAAGTGTASMFLSPAHYMMALAKVHESVGTFIEQLEKDHPEVRNNPETLKLLLNQLHETGALRDLICNCNEQIGEQVRDGAEGSIATIGARYSLNADLKIKHIYPGLIGTTDDPEGQVALIR